MPAIPGLPAGVQKPEVPGYVTAEQHQAAALACQENSDKMKMIAGGVGLGALVIGALIGRAMKK
jgi:hypothetical protein